MTAVLTTVPEDAARKVAEDIRDYGHGYIRIDREGRAEHVPSYLVSDRSTARAGQEQRE